MIVEFVFAVLGFLLSPLGAATALAGVAAVFIAPIIPRVTGVGKPISNAYLYMALYCLDRAALVVSEHAELFLKRMQFSDRGVETMQFDGMEKEFEDPDGALSHWLGFPFALADEEHGILFDPRHAAIGERIRDLDRRDLLDRPATDAEWQAFDGVRRWKRAVIGLPAAAHTLVDLTGVRRLVDGGERAEYPARTGEMYKHSRKPFQNRGSSVRYLLPIVSFLLTFAGVWFVATQFQGGGGSGASSTLTGLSSLLVALPTLSTRRRHALKLLVVVLMLLTIPAGLVVFTGPIFAAVVGVTFGIGVFVIFVFAFIGQWLAPEALARLFMILGFLNYDRPVFEWTPSGYRLREADALPETAPEPTWYGFANSVVGFTVVPKADVWGADHISHETLEDRQGAVADGGTVSVENVPSEHVAASDLGRAEYGGFVPEPLDDGMIYLHRGRAQARFKNTATGLKSLRKLLEVKDEFGEGGFGLSERAMLYAVLGMGMLGFIAGVVLFLL